MCSISAILELKASNIEARDTALRLSGIQRHRGPDWSGVRSFPKAVLAHERLAIVDVAHGAQPIEDNEGRRALSVNGEIYNHRELKASLQSPYAFSTESDCEVILALYLERGTDFLDDVIGIFAFVLYDEVADRYVVARDPIGVVPLYMGRDANGQLIIASEMKALMSVCTEVKEFPPGHVLDSAVGELRRYYHRPWMEEVPHGGPTSSDLIRQELEAAVHRQLMSDVPYGVLISGGLDSSVIAAVTAQYARRRIEDDDRSEAWWPRLHSFSIGLQGSPDLAMAAKMAKHIGTVHHEFTYTIQEGLDALSDVIYHLETYDVTTIRAGTPMYLMARRIRSTGVKMVLSGEGADEVFGGYLYFHKAPNAEAFHTETVRKLDRLHSYDCLRANKAMAAWGLEARVPFLDQRFLDVAMSLDPEAKRILAGRQEKQIVRDAFKDLLPEVIWARQKEQFSDGVGYGWIDSLKENADARVSDQRLASAADRFPHNPPTTKEGYLFREIFDKHFPLPSAAACVPGGPSVACSTPEALAWDDSLRQVTDPSGRAVLGVHEKSY